MNFLVDAGALGRFFAGKPLVVRMVGGMPPAAVNSQMEGLRRRLRKSSPTG
jgi:hypothetical protein